MTFVTTGGRTVQANFQFETVLYKLLYKIDSLVIKGPFLSHWWHPWVPWVRLLEQQDHRGQLLCANGWLCNMCLRQLVLPSISSLKQTVQITSLASGGWFLA